MSISNLIPASANSITGSLVTGSYLNAATAVGTLASAFGFNGGSLTNPGASDPNTPTNTLAGALSRGDPMLSYQWYCIMPTIAPQGGGPTALPWSYVEEATPTFRSFDVRSIFREGRERHYPSRYSVDSLRLAIYADSNNVALKYLTAWQSAILYPTTSNTAAMKGGGYGRPNSYKATIKIYLLNAAKAQLACLEYSECWPQTIDAYSLDSGSSTRVMNHVAFSVGDVFISQYTIPNTISLASVVSSISSLSSNVLSAAGNPSILLTPSLANSVTNATSQIGGLF